MVKSVFKLTLAAVLVSAGLMMVISGVQHAGAAAAKVSPAGTVSVTATAAPSGRISAELVGYGTDRDTYSRGDTANGYITLRNTGDAAINDVTVHASISKNVPVLGTTSLGSKDFKIANLNIGPGETKKAQFSVTIPEEYSGFSTAGDYQLNGKVLVSGKEIGDFSKSVKVV
ncbi:MAG TPA: hypothetical protein VMC84_08720 [Methanocella sp.]|uniref:hypothetical protein n=1 Tax=Methanocella sp. TaxID=2052833 RepID=UPI002BA62C71|nr:hypothetical protein [Methanocella sp.]HTY91244.1 hypothetical protein [Methanocella sp.]